VLLLRIKVYVVIYGQNNPTRKNGINFIFVENHTQRTSGEDFLVTGRYDALKTPTDHSGSNGWEIIICTNYHWRKALRMPDEEWDNDVETKRK
jgi:hypothetical protein